jgi:Fe(3+) dicitrate transport protein
MVLRSFNKRVFLVAASLVALSSESFSQNVTFLPKVVVTAPKEEDEDLDGGKVKTNFTGALYYIPEDEIKDKQTNDVNRILREIPSVNLQEEDGYGIRPNIGIRGSRNDRSADIVIMEDGILVSPAPYAAPSAYYFPAVGRTSGIELYKGAGSIKYGPRTTSGALNIVTTPIPDSEKISFSTSAGSFNEKNANLSFGNSYENFGYVLNFDHKSSDGFKKLDGGGDIGFTINDFLSKFRLGPKDNHLEFKLGYTDEDSRESYVGLTQGDFVADPYRRYMSTKLDGMKAQNSQYEVSHKFKSGDDFSVTTTAYYHYLNRSWYRLDRVDNDTTDATSSRKVNSIFSDNLTSYINIIRGDVSGYANHQLEINANNRSFVAQGIQSIADSKFEIAATKHNLKYGIRLHDDFEDRFQRVDKYQISAGSLNLVSYGIDGVGSGNNRVGKVRAFSTFAEDEIIFGKWTITPGLRFEHLDIKQKNYGSSDPTRSSSPVITNNIEDVLIPGIGTSYSFTKDFGIFANIHKGFGPPAPGSSANAEESVNYEAGWRLRGENNMFLENVFFLNNYSNLIGTDSSGDGNQVNGGKVQSYGVEVVAGYDVKTDVATFPLKATYSYNHSEFKSSFDASDTIDEWGNVEKGDLLPYVSPHQVSLSAGIKVAKIDFALSTKYVDAMRTTASKGSIDKSNKIPSHFVTDAVLFYEMHKDLRFFTAIDNIFNREYAVASRPAGFRPGKPLAARIGVTIDF